MFLSFKAMVCNPAAERKMFEAERNSGIQKFEEISFGSLIIFLFIPANRAILRVNCGYSSMLLEKSNTAPFVGTPFLSSFHFERISPVGSYNAVSGIRPPSIPRRMQLRIKLSSRFANVTPSAASRSHTYICGWWARICSSYISVA